MKLTNCFLKLVAVILFSASLVFAQTDFWVKTNLAGTAITYMTTNVTNGYLFAGNDTIIFRSIDSGENWTSVGSDLVNAIIYSVIVHPLTQDVYAATFRGVFVSKDNGAHWTKILPDKARSIAVNDSGHIFVGSGHQVGLEFELSDLFWSTDNGQSWKQDVATEYDEIQVLVTKSSQFILGGTDEALIYSREYRNVSQA